MQWLWKKWGHAILYEDCFTILCKKEDNSLPLPGGKYLVAESKKQLENHMKQEFYVRCYTKMDYIQENMYQINFG